MKRARPRAKYLHISFIRGMIRENVCHIEGWMESNISGEIDLICIVANAALDRERSNLSGL
ncbi:hypothetical protein Scep_026214 [Stephania cephalantha]|uniref:Uncharacterized protein n=1 Tax=Stephania cephalantha TaxID=152367 RepID=A0AAP0EM89_9MAGN